MVVDVAWGTAKEELESQTGARRPHKALKGLIRQPYKLTYKALKGLIRPLRAL